MKKVIIFLSIAFVHLLPGSSNAQTNYWEENHHIPITPNAAALFKPLEKPVGPFSGIVPVSIPIHTCTYKGYNLPISLSYNAGGIKVEEIASSVGLGWSLSAGGRISLVQRGLHDDIYLEQEHKPSSSWPYTSAGLDQYLLGNVDYEPDLFVFNANGISGQMVFDEAENVVVLNKQLNMKAAGATSNFVLTDDKGYTYEFNTADVNIVTFRRTGWHLDRIADMNGETIATFEYQNMINSYEVRSLTSFTSDEFGGQRFGCEDRDWYSVYTNTWTEHIAENHLSKITMGDEIIVFNLDTSRADLDFYKVGSIEIRDGGNNIRQKIKLNYGYFPSGNLKLKNVAVFPAAGTDSLTHSFTYREDMSYYNRFSNSIDYWGYYNGAGNPTTVPNNIYKYGGYTVGIGDQADRRANPVTAVANILTKITFPSGGYRSFEYEGNEVLYSNYNTELYPDVEDHINNVFDTTVFNMDPNYPQYERMFTVNSTNGYTLFYFNLDGFGYNISIKLYGGSDQLIKELYDEESGYWTLPNGNYRIEVMFDVYFAWFSGFYCYWDDQNLTTATIGDFKKQNQHAGGLRIKTIDDYDGLVNKHYITRYKYNLPSDTTLSSGMLIMHPKILYRSSCEDKNCGLIRIASQSAYPLNTDNGSYVLYPHVRVIEEGKGRTDLIYQFWADDDLTFYGFPIMHSRDNGFKRGQLLSERHYNEGGSLVQLDTFTYTVPTSELHSYTNYSYGVKISIWDMSNYNYPEFCTENYNNLVDCGPLPLTERSITYTPSGNLETKTMYDYYTGLGATKLKKKSVLGSRGDTVIQYYHYPFNTNAEFKLPMSIAEKAMKQTFLDLNFLEPMESLSYRKNGNDSLLLEGVKSSYSSFYYGTWFPATVKRYTSANDSATIHFSNYGSDGKLQERYKASGVKEVFLWGYGRKYVVARITGSDYATVAALVNNAVVQSPSSEAALRIELNKIRTGLAGSKAQVTTYTFLPAVGVSSVTDASGNTLYYEYDLHARLTRIRDQDNNIIKKINYHVTQ